MAKISGQVGKKKLSRRERRVQNLLAHVKWTDEHPEEAARRDRRQEELFKFSLLLMAIMVVVGMSVYSLSLSPELQWVLMVGFLGGVLTSVLLGMFFDQAFSD